MNGMFSNYQCSICPDECTIGKIMRLGGKIGHFQGDIYTGYFM